MSSEYSLAPHQSIERSSYLGIFDSATRGCKRAHFHTGIRSELGEECLLIRKQRCVLEGLESSWRRPNEANRSHDLAFARDRDEEIAVRDPRVVYQPVFRYVIDIPCLQVRLCM